MSRETCPVKVRQTADPDCRENCPFQIERQGAAERLQLIWLALLHDRDQADDHDRVVIDAKLGALETMIESQEAVAEGAATTCQLPEWHRRFFGVLGAEVAHCSSPISLNYDKAISRIDYAPVAEALALIVSRPVAREFLIDAVASSGIEFPTLRTEEPVS